MTWCSITAIHLPSFTFYLYVQEIRELLFWFTRKTPVDGQKAQSSHYFKMLIEPETFPAGQHAADASAVVHVIDVAFVLFLPT